MQNLRPFLSQFGIMSLINFMTVGHEFKKKRRFTDEEYNILRKDAKQEYKEDIDESQEDGLLWLLKQKGQKLDPELQKRLQVYASWQKGSLWDSFVGLTPVLIPIFLGGLAYPRVMVWTSFAYGLVGNYYYENEREVISGGKHKSFWKKDALPERKVVDQYFTFFGCGVLAVTLFTMKFSKNSRSLKDFLIQNWKKSQKK